MFELQKIFNYREKQLRTVMKGEEVWFVAKDVCDILELEQVTRAMDRLDEDEGGLLEVTHPQNPEKTLEVNCVNEFGLYTLILRSEMPEAKKFKRWITHEVIPAIRKTGIYSMNEIPTNKDKDLQLRADKEARLLAKEKRLSAQFFKEVIDDFSSVLSPSSIKQAVYEISTMLFGKGIVERPILGSKLYKAGEIGKELGVSGNRIGRVANKHNLKTKENGEHVLDISSSSSKQVENFMYNEIGRQKIKELLQNEN